MKPHVLIVDDNRELAENLAELIEDEGCRVSIAHSGEQALDLAEEQRFDLVLTDIVMPGISGIELVRRLSQRQPATTYLLMTAYISDSLMQQAQAIRYVRAVLAKPLDIERLLPMLPREPGARVLLATPDAGLTALLGECLRVHGYQVQAASDAADARRVSDDARPRIAVIDRRLAEDDSGGLVRGLSDAGVPVLVIAGDDARALESGLARVFPRGVQFLDRQVSTEELLSAIESAMARDVAS